MAIKPMTENTIVITGATSGIGLATAIGLAKRGAYVIGVGRSILRCEEAESIIKDAAPDGRISFLLADLSSQKQIRELADKIKGKVREERDGTIDVLINNAGTFSSWFTSTEDGFELQFAVNHLAPFLLTHQLLPLLMAAPTGRIITVSSGSHYRTKINWKDLQLRRHYNCLMAYKQSKLANVLFILELNRRLGRDSTLRAFAADPGLVNTEMGLKGTMGIARWVWERRRKKGLRPEEGAATSIYLATEPIVPDAKDIYWKNSSPTPPSRYVYREDVAERLWSLSEKMCGVSYAEYGLGS